MKLWRWVLTDNYLTVIKQESGSREDLREAMIDIANTVEYLINGKNDKNN
jgi:hypothetical protein